MTHRFQALGTTWWITLFNPSLQTHDVIFDDIVRFVAAYENAYSRFLPHSIVSTLNSQRVLYEPSAELVEILQYGKALFLKTGGRFNLLTGHIQEANGYDSSYSFFPQENIPAAGNPITDLTITSQQITLHQGHIDIGGFGKGYLIDLLAKRLKSIHQETEFLINGGGDMYGSSEQGQPITIHLEDPTRPQHYLLETTLLNQGFAASSPFKRQWTVLEQTYSHIIGDTTQTFATFVKAPTAALADALATTGLLITEKQTVELAQEENASTARYYPETQKLWRMNSFHPSL